MKKEEREEKVEDAKTESETKLLETIESKFSLAEKAQNYERLNSDFPWDDREDLFFGKYKHPEEKTKSILSTGELPTIAINGACRTMAQLPTGRFYNYNGKKASNIAMNLLFEHYIIPNATNGGHLLMKHRMTDMYSRVLPVIFNFVEWNASEEENDYNGPDMVSTHPRRCYPQPGKNAVEDMDWFFIDVEVSKEWLKTRNKDIWKNVDAVLENYKDEKEEAGAGTPIPSRSPDERNKVKSGITLRHMFKSNGDWIVYAPFEGEGKTKILINEKKYYPCIPIASKVQYPRMDSVYGFNDFDRGQMTQKSIDSVVRMALDGYAIMIKPPVMIDPKKASLSSVVMGAGEKWVGEIGSVQVQNVNPNALNALQAMYGMLKGNLLSMGAQQDTSVPIGVDAGMGKTPEAIKAQGSKQGARDSWDTFMMERHIERVYTIMADMIAHKGVKQFAFNLVGDSLKKIQDQYPEEDLKEFLDGEKVTIDVDYLKGQYRYVIDPGSTGLKKDDTGEQMLSFVDIYNKYPGIAEDFAASGQKFNQGEAFKRAFIDSGVQDSEKIISTEETPEGVDGIGPEGSTLDQPGMSIPAPAQMMPQIPTPQPQMPMMPQMAPQMAPQMSMPQMPMQPTAQPQQPQGQVITDPATGVQVVIDPVTGQILQ